MVTIQGVDTANMNPQNSEFLLHLVLLQKRHALLDAGGLHFDGTKEKTETEYQILLSAPLASAERMLKFGLMDFLD